MTTILCSSKYRMRLQGIIRIMTFQSIQIELGGVNVRRGDRVILDDIEWRIQSGEHWGVFGPNGCGKSTLMKLLRGEVWPSQPSRGKRVYLVDGEPQTSPLGAKKLIGYVSPELHDAYLRHEWNPSVEETIASGFSDSVWVYSALDALRQKQLLETAERIGVSELLKRNFLELSQGQARRVLLARALVKQPALLILDECCNGLDEDSRGEFVHWVNEAANHGAQIIFTSHRDDDRPACLNRAIYLNEGRIERLEEIETTTPGKRNGLTLDLELADRFEAMPESVAPRGEPLVELKNVSVWLEGVRVLHAINWRIEPGEHWALIGPNGCGKSTLLRLLYAEERAELGGEVRFFGQDGLTPVEAIRRRVAMVSPRLQGGYRYNVSALETVASGFFASISLYQELTPEQWDAARDWLVRLGLGDKIEQPIHTMSYGELRKTMLARAMILDPELLLLDEPFDGLDASARPAIARDVDRLVEHGTQIVLATHHAHDLPGSINRVVRIQEGRIVERLRRKR